jgi:hypothetical protein
MRFGRAAAHQTMAPVCLYEFGQSKRWAEDQNPESRLPSNDP